MIQTHGKTIKMNKLSTNRGVIAALAIDQRGSLKTMLESLNFTGDKNMAMKEIKDIVAHELTPFASAILLDVEYGMTAARDRNPKTGLLLSYELSGDGRSNTHKYPYLVDDLSVTRIVEHGGDAVKLLLYYDADDHEEVNKRKHVFIERVGNECRAMDIPFFLEIISYDAGMQDATSKGFARMKPDKVYKAMREFSKERYGVDVLKVEIPVNIEYVEGFALHEDDVVFSRDEALAIFRQQNKATHLPFIYLSAGVDTSTFHQSLELAVEAGSSFSGVLCGRATWKEVVQVYVENGKNAAIKWLQTKGVDNMKQLNDIILQNATPWNEK